MTESECSVVFLFAKVTTIAVNMIFHRGGGQNKTWETFAQWQRLGSQYSLSTKYFDMSFSSFQLHKSTI